MNPEKIERFSMDGLNQWMNTNRRALVKSAPRLFRMMASIRKGKKRSICEDAIILNRRFGIEIDFQNLEKIPEEGGLILATSHAYTTTTFPGWENPRANFVWWGGAIAEALRKRRPQSEFKPIICYETRPKPDPNEEESFRRFDRLCSKYLGVTSDQLWNQGFINTYDCFPVNSARPRLSLRSLKEATQAARNGDIIIIAPEGTTHTSLANAKRGIAKLVDSDCPFVPIAFWEEKKEDEYTYHLNVGEPIKPDLEDWENLSRRERKTRELEFADEIMMAIAELMPEKKRGVYGISVDPRGFEPLTSPM